MHEQKTYVDDLKVLALVFITEVMLEAAAASSWTLVSSPSPQSDINQHSHFFIILPRDFLFLTHTNVTHMRAHMRGGVETHSWQLLKIWRCG